MSVLSHRVALAREDLLLLGDQPELLAIADAVQTTQRLPLRAGFQASARAPRTRPRRPRRLGTAAVVGTILIAALAGAALAGAFGVFDGTPAPPSVQQKFAFWNQHAGWIMNPSTKTIGPPPPEPAQSAPSIDPSKAHGVLEAQLGAGLAAYYIWAAPLTNGDGECAIISHTDGQGNMAGGSMSPGYSWCVTATTSSQPRTWGEFGPGGFSSDGPPERVLPGKAPGASMVKVKFEDGTSTDAPVVEGFFLLPITGPARSPGTEPTAITSYDAQGNVIGQANYPLPVLPSPSTATARSTTPTGTPPTSTSP